MADDIQDDESQPVPVEFDLDAWIDGAQIAQRSVLVYGRPDLVAAMEDADRRHRLAKAASDGALASAEVDQIEAEMDDLIAQMEASKSTWYLSGLSPDQVKAAENAAPIPTLPDDAGPEQVAAAEAAVEEQNLRYIAASVVKIVAANGAVKTGVTYEQMVKLRERLGTRQIMALKNAAARAQIEEPKVPVPFSHRKSVTDPT